MAIIVVIIIIVIAVMASPSTVLIIMISPSMMTSAIFAIVIGVIDRLHMDGARHIDVVISGVAVAIVIVMMAAPKRYGHTGCNPVSGYKLIDSHSTPGGDKQAGCYKGFT